MSGKVTLIQKEGKNHPVVSKRIAALLVEEGAAIKTNRFYNFFKMRFTNDELIEYILKRDHHTCRICGEEAKNVSWLKKEQEEGLRTPVNLISSCEKCNEKLENNEIDKAITYGFRKENISYEKNQDNEKNKNEQKNHRLSVKIKNEEENKANEKLKKQIEEKIVIHYTRKNKFSEIQNYYHLKKNLLKRMSFESHEYQYTKRRKTRIKKVKIKEHAFERWNMRIGPIIHRFSELENFMQQLFLEPDRLIFLSEEYGVIDNEIVFTYDIYGEVLFITTFYGRVSLHPSLGDIEYIKRWQNRSNERLNLEIDERILKKQKMPLLAYDMLSFSGKNHDYKLEEYETEKGRKLFLFILNHQPNEPKMREINKNNLKGLGKSIKRGVRYMELNNVD